MANFEFKEKNKMWKNQRHTNKIAFAEEKKPVDVECTSFFNYAFDSFFFFLKCQKTFISRISIRIRIHIFQEVPLNIYMYINTLVGAYRNQYISCVLKLRFLSSKFCSFLVILSTFSVFYLFVSFLFFTNSIQFPNSVITLAGFVSVWVRTSSIC